MEASASVTEAFHNLLPKGIPYQTYIIVERNPDTLYDGTCVDANEKRLRYFVISVIPDTEYPFDYSYPLIHTMWMVSLHCWELIRAALGACTKEMQVLLAKNPVPPILNNARLEWVSLYLGREPYKGICKLSEQWVEAEDLRRIIHTTGALIVVSSAWRQIPTCYQHLQEWLAKYDMEVYDKTPYVGGDRGDDISAWFNRHPGNWQYAILDDDDDMGDHIDHLVRTDFDLGLTEREADRCIALLQRED